MIKTEATLRAWGNSIGVVLPMDGIKQEHLGKGDVVEVTIKKRQSPLREIFGKSKFKGSTEELLKEVDRDLNPD